LRQIKAARRAVGSSLCELQTREFARFAQRDERKRARKRAEVITGSCGERGGAATKACRFVETPMAVVCACMLPPGGVDVEALVADDE